MSHTVWSVYVCLFWAHRWSVQKWLNRSRCCLGDGLMWAQGTLYCMGSRSSNRKLDFLREHMRAQYNLPTHECIPHCLPATAGKHACPTFAADKCVLPSAKLLSWWLWLNNRQHVIKGNGDILNLLQRGLTNYGHLLSHYLTGSCLPTAAEDQPALVYIEVCL